ncbi:DUF3833 domain-containing protein [Vibrio sp. WXL103]|uniref:DUF3833 domain-containing protein n=1 Tax=unclassified Vibrio TaxID=2614977 RepID=UPI003EC7D9A2
MKIFKSVFLLLAVMSVGCSADIDDYEQTNPDFDLFGFFDGQVKAWGMVQDYSDKQTRRFEVDIVGEVNGETLTLVEDFVFDDGEISQRIWVITQQGVGQYTGTADDVVGEATGIASGNALNWRYKMDLAVGDDTYRVTFDDWMYRQDERNMFNIATISKFGVDVGTVTLFFTRLDAGR